ncbi:MAG: bifunctional UDP-N-acetylglucosamine diphosphorylase/glucosamine-1-phosphate N-acetyltransferase GlmU [Halanaerobiales bacterium]
MNLLSIVLAAGKGTRMKSNIPKVLHPVGGESMLSHVLDKVFSMNSKIITVVGYRAEKVRNSIEEERRVRFVKQKNQLGTGHAVLQAKKYIENHEGPVLILYGDTPLLTEKSLSNMVDYFKSSNAEAAVLTAFIENPRGYGRIVRDEKENIKKIVEESDATSKEKAIKEINTGVYCFDSTLLAQGLENLECDNAQEEYYLTDIISYAGEKDKKVIPVPVEDNQEIIGVNNRKDLAEAEKIYRKLINETHMQNGVSILDPDTTFIDKKVKIGQDTIIYPFTYIEGNSEIGENTIIGPHCRIVNSTLGKNIELKSNCNIWDSIIENKCTIGPFAYIRPGTRLKEGVKIGDFVELKKAEVDQNTKIPHLSYVGDAEIGKKTNIGAGTVFANYDGKNKHKTKVGDSAFIGSNSTLVAPLKIGDKGKTGAGAVVTKDVSDDTTVIGVPARVYKKKK